MTEKDLEIQQLRAELKRYKDAEKEAALYSERIMERVCQEKRRTVSCDSCGFCRFPRSNDDNWGCCKCAAMRYKTIDVCVTDGKTPEWCPFKRAETISQEKKEKDAELLRSCCCASNEVDE